MARVDLPRLRRRGTPFGKLNLVFRTAFSLSVSRGGLCLALRRVAQALTPTYDALVAQVQHAPIVAADETGWKVGGHLLSVGLRYPDPHRLPDHGRPRLRRSLLHPQGRLLRHPASRRLGTLPLLRARGAPELLAHPIRRCRENLETAQRGAARLPRAILRILLHALELRDRWRDEPPKPRGRAVHVGRIEAAARWRPCGRGRTSRRRLERANGLLGLLRGGPGV